MAARSAVQWAKRTNLNFLLCSNWKNGAEFHTAFAIAGWLEFIAAKASDGCKELPADGLEGCRRHNYNGLELHILELKLHAGNGGASYVVGNHFTGNEP